MKAICVELVERGAGEADVFDGVQFDVIVVRQNDLFQTIITLDQTAPPSAPMHITTLKTSIA